MRRLAALTVAVTVAASAAGERPASAAYPGTNGKIAYVRDSEIFVMEADGSNVTRLTFTTGNNETHPVISPDGTKIAFASDRGGNGWDIWVMGIDGANPTRLTTGSEVDHNPTWSPDQTKIAFETGRTGLTSTIWVMNADGSNPVKIIDRYPSSNVEDPAWSPDGSRIAYVRSNPSSALAAASAVDGTAEVIFAAANSRYPAWSPDGSKLAYQRRIPSTGVADIYSVVLATGVETNLTADAADDHDPAYSPDGTQIAYAVLSGQWEVFRMNADGTGKVNVTNNNPAASDNKPDWGPGAAAPPPPPPPATPCIIVRPATPVDFGTRSFSTPTATVRAQGSPDVQVENCGSSAAQIHARGTAATGGGTTWTLSAAADPCAGAANVFGLSLGALALTTNAQLLGSLAPGATRTETPTLTMPCTGSGGTGSTLEMQIIFTATT